MKDAFLCGKCGGVSMATLDAFQQQELSCPKCGARLLTDGHITLHMTVTHRENLDLQTTHSPTLRHDKRREIARKRAHLVSRNEGRPPIREVS